MASPPHHNHNHTAPSPPPLSLSLPRQRPNLSLPPQHRKNSTAGQQQPTSAHPLRQTSFPPSETNTDDRDAFSPAESLDSLDDADIRSAVGEDSSIKKRKRGEKRPRGRPPKDPRAYAARKAGSVHGSEGTVKHPRGNGDPSVLTPSDDDDDDDENEAGGDGPGRAAGDFSLLPAEMDRDKQRKFLFREAIPPAHQARYDSFNTVKLKAGEVRKLVNNVLSQSVPANVVTVVGSYTKMFAGMLIESARECQAERLAVKRKRPDGEDNAAWRRLQWMEVPPEDGEEEGWATESEEDHEEDGDAKHPSPRQEDVSLLPDGDPNSADEAEEKRTHPQKPSKKKSKRTHLDSSLPEYDFSHVEPGAWGLGKFVEDCDRGPLQPDDLREALRRYKRGRAGGSVGFTGISLEGREAVASRMGGRRLFR